MAWDGSGNFSRTNGVHTGSNTWQDDRDAATKIRADRHDTHDQDLSDGIDACLTQDNQSKPTAHFAPNASNSYDLGTNSLQWKDLYVDGTAYLDAADITALSIGSVAVTSTAAELNILDGVTANAADINVIAGGAAAGVSAAEFQYLNGVTSAIQTQLDAKQPLDSDLTAIAALSNTEGNIICGNGVTWTTRSGSQARSTIGIDGVSGVIAAGDLATGVGVWIPLSTVNIAGSQYATFTNGSGGVVIDSTYDYYMLQWTNVYYSSSDSFTLQVGTSGGFLTSNYVYNTAFNSGTGTTGASYVLLGTFAGSEYFDGQCFFRYPHTATRTILEITNMEHTSTPTLANRSRVGMNTTTTAVDRIRIGGAATAMTSGTVTLFALKK